MGKSAKESTEVKPYQNQKRDIEKALELCEKKYTVEIKDNVLYFNLHSHKEIEKIEEELKNASETKKITYSIGYRISKASGDQMPNKEPEDMPDIRKRPKMKESTKNESKKEQPKEIKKDGQFSLFDMI